MKFILYQGVIMEFWERWRAFQAECKETQIQTAPAAGIASCQCQGLEGATSVPHFYNFCALAVIFAVTPDCLSGRSGER